MQIFISHSSTDAAAASKLKDLLDERGYASIFLDFDPEHGIPAGHSWEAELYRNLKSCRALIALCSADSMASRWCFAEITQAKALGKPIFPVKLSACDIDNVLTDRQVIDVSVVGYDRLWLGLQRAGLDPDFDADATRPPYPGLRAFEAADAAYFFGRDDEIGQTLELLAQMRRHDDPRFALVLGASGCGKSSLVRAGVLPRLGRDSERWLVVPPFRPGNRPTDAAARALAEVFAEFDNPKDWRVLRDLINTGSDAWADIVADLTLQAGAREASVVLVIDQLEEALGPREAGGGDEFLVNLLGTLQSRDADLLVLATLRSDFLGHWQRYPGVESTPFETIPLGPMPISRLPQVIEGPAHLKGLDFEAGLVQRMVTDTGTEAGLPLLAFTLREIYKRCKDDGIFTLKVYEDDLGGIQGSVERVADEAIRPGSLSAESKVALRSAFLRMVRVNEDGQYTRRTAHGSDLPAAAFPHLEKLIKSWLLVSRGEGTEREIEVAHEALFGAWRTLSQWLDEERSFLLWRRRLHTDAEDWLHHDRHPGSLLQGAALDEARTWIEKHSGELDSSEQEFVEASVKAEGARKRRKRVFQLAGGAVAAIVVTLGVWAAYLQRQGAETSKIATARDLTIKAELIADREVEKIQIRALLATEALKRFDALGRHSAEADIALRRALGLLPSKRYEHEHKLDRGVAAVAFGPGRNELTVVLDRAWGIKVINRKDGSETEFMLPEVRGMADKIALSDDGRYVATAVSGTNVSPGGTVQLWQIGQQEPVGRFGYQGRIHFLSLTRDASYLAIRGYDDDKLSIYTRKGVLVGQLPASGVRNIALSPDSRYLAVAGKDGGVWEIDQRGDQPLRKLPGYQGDTIRRYLFSPDGNHMGSIDRQTRSLEVWRTAKEKEERLRLPLIDQMVGVSPTALSYENRYLGFIRQGPEPGRSSFFIQRLANGEIARIDLQGKTEDTRFRHNQDELVIAGGTSIPVQVWRLTSETHHAQFQAAEFVEDMHFISNVPSPYLVTLGWRKGDSDQTDKRISLRVFDVDKGFEKQELHTEQDASARVLTHDGLFLVMATTDDKIQIWSTIQGESIASFDFKGLAELVALSHDRRIVTAVGGGQVSVWTLPEGQRRTFKYDGRASALELGPLGRFLVVFKPEIDNPGTRSRRLPSLVPQIYDLDTGQIKNVDFSTRDVNKRAIQAPGGTTYRSAVTGPNTATVWVQPGELFARIEDVEPMRLSTVDSQGRYLATATPNGLVRLWPLTHKALIAMACARLEERRLYVQEWLEYLPQEEAPEPVCADDPGQPGTVP